MLGIKEGSSPYAFTEDIRIKVGESITMHYAQPLVSAIGVDKDNIMDVRKTTTYGKQSKISIEGAPDVARLTKNSAGAYCLPITITGKQAGTAIVTSIIIAGEMVGGTATRVIVTEADKTSSSASDKTSTKAPAASSKSVTFARTQPKKTTNGKLVSYSGVANKKGTESITLENVVATKKGKVTVLSRPNVVDKRTTYKFTATIYDIPVGSKIITTSKPVAGKKSVVDVEAYKYDSKSKKYVTQQNSTTHEIGEITVSEKDIGLLLQPTIKWDGLSVCGSATYDDVADASINSADFSAKTVFVRVVAAK